MGIFSKLFKKKEAVKREKPENYSYEANQFDIENWFAKFMEESDFKYLPMDNMRFMVKECSDYICNDAMYENEIKANIDRGDKPYIISLKVIDDEWKKLNVNEINMILDIHYRGQNGFIHHTKIDVVIHVKLFEQSKVQNIIGYTIDFMQVIVNHMTKCLCDIELPKPHKMNNVLSQYHLTSVKEYCSSDRVTYKLPSIEDEFIEYNPPIIEKAFIDNNTVLDSAIKTAMIISPIRKRVRGVMTPEEFLNKFEPILNDDSKGTVGEWLDASAVTNIEKENYKGTQAESLAEMVN